MKRLSFWAGRNIWPARIIIILSLILLHCLAISMGDLVNEMGLRISFLLFYPVAAVCLYAFIFYPFRSDKGRYKNFYLVRKTFDGLLAVSTFLMLFIGANHDRFVVPVPENIDFSITSAGSSIEKPGKEKKKKKWQSPRKKLKENLQILRKLYKQGTPAEKIALIIISIVVAVGLLFLVAALACNLSCAGSDAAAVLVGLGGTALIIFLFVRVIRGLNRKFPRQPREEGQR